jgi:hypothetical protein
MGWLLSGLGRGLLPRLWISVLQVRKNNCDEKTNEEWIDKRHRKPPDHQSGKLWPQHFKRHYEKYRTYTGHQIREQGEKLTRERLQGLQRRF